MSKAKKRQTTYRPKNWIVLKRKISGPTSSTRGQQFVARDFSAMESCRRQGRDLRAWLGAGAAAALTFLTFCALCPGKLSLPGCTGLGVSRRECEYVR